MLAWACPGGPRSAREARRGDFRPISGTTFERLCDRAGTPTKNARPSRNTGHAQQNRRSGSPRATRNRTKIAPRACRERRSIKNVGKRRLGSSRSRFLIAPERPGSLPGVSRGDPGTSRTPKSNQKTSKSSSKRVCINSNEFSLKMSVSRESEQHFQKK